MAYTKKIWKDYPDTTTPIKAEYMNNIENGIEEVNAFVEEVNAFVEEVNTSVNNGWINPNETWTYASVDDPTGVITISGDKTTKYSLGMRIMFTNATNVIYGIITAISYSSPNTTLTFLHEIDPTDSLALYLMANSAITNNYYSSVKAPFGFPMSADKWSTIKTDTSDRSQSSPNGETWYNLGGVYLDIPIGYWDLGYKLTAQNGASDSTSANRVITTTLSTTNNDTTNPEYNMQTAVVGNYIRNTFEKNEKKSFTTKTRVYLNTMSDTAVDKIYNLGGGKPTQIIAVCAYL